MSTRPNESTIRQRVWTLVEPVCADAGYDLVDVRFVTEQNGWVLRVLIDVAPDEEGSGGRAAQRSAAVAANAAHASEAPAGEADDALAADDDDALAADDDDADEPDGEDELDGDDSDDQDDLEAAADAIGSLAPSSHAGPSDGDIDLADCERISRELSAVLDVDDPITIPYSLEVSSPGIDRPLVTEAHFRRYAGAEIKVALHRGVPTPMGSERKNFRGLLAGVEGSGKDAHAKVIVDGQPWLLPIDDVDHARIVPDWDDVMRGGRGQIRTGAAADASAGTKHPHAKPGAHGKLPHPKAAEAAAAHAAKLAAEAAHGHGSKKKSKKARRDDDAPTGSPDHDEPAGSQTTSRRDDDRAS